MSGFLDSQLLYRLRNTFRKLPRTKEEALSSDIYNCWWYYDAELFPGVTTKGTFPGQVPLLPRMLLRNCELANCDCLDIGSMEGLIPILMRKQGARGVLATDFSYHCYDKMLTLMKLHGVELDFKKVDLLYDLSKKIPDRRYHGFDLINVSGVLYHVFSPFHVIAGLRPLLKKNGLMIVSTNVINRDDVSMEFNDRGKLQTEGNTFWYLSVKMLDYMLKYFQLEPIDFLYYKISADNPLQHKAGQAGYDVGYLSVVCRAVSDQNVSLNDPWMISSIKEAWEYALCDQRMLDSQGISDIGYKFARSDFDLPLGVRENAPLGAAAIEAEDTHLLSLADRI